MSSPNATLQHGSARRDLAHVKSLRIPSVVVNGQTIPARQVDWYRVRVLGGQGQIGPQRGQVRAGDKLSYGGSELTVSAVLQDDGSELTVRAA